MESPNSLNNLTSKTVPEAKKIKIKPLGRFRFNSFVAGVLAVLVISGIGFLIWTLARGGGVEFGVVGPNEVKAGETREFKLVYNNKSRVALEDTQLILNLPDGVISSDNPEERVITANLDKISPNANGEKVFKLMFFGEDRSSRNLQATLRYRPSSLTSQLEKDTSYSVVIAGSTFVLNTTLPSQVLPDQNFPMSINYENQSENQYNDVRLWVDWPSDYSFSSSKPQPSEKNNIWYLGQVSAGLQNKIDINGALSSSEGESRKFVVNVAVYLNNKPYIINKTDNFLAVVPNPLVMSASVNGDISYNADPGETLNFRITYRNDYKEGLRNVIVKAKFDGSMFDLSTLKTGKGYYSAKDKVIIWNGANTPNLLVLNPNEEGQLDFSINLVKNYPIKTALDKNFVLAMNATVDTSTIPADIGIDAPISAATSVAIKINTKADLSTTALFRDVPSTITNDGKLPLRINQLTQFTVHWKIKNYANALKDVEVKTILPAGVVFTDRIAGNYGDNKPVYNDRTGEFSWTIPSIPAGSGISSKAYELIFQISVTPLANQANQAINLTNETTLTGQDIFTLKNISVTAQPIRSDALSDLTVLPEQGIVRP